MLLLGIDTSCDDTSASVVSDGTEILSNVVSSQSEIHAKYGGIVPELASRRHIEMIWPVVDEALGRAQVALDDVEAIAVCHGPGLIGSLLVGCGFAKAVGYVKGIPLVTVNHLEGHIFSVFLEHTPPRYPFISLIVSGGHTSLYLVRGFGKYLELGRTRDDAAGEAYDKAAKLLGVGYPGGPVIERLAQSGDRKEFGFPRAYLPETLDFSFSGLKTALMLKTAELGIRSGDGKAHRCDSAHATEAGDSRDRVFSNLAASFQAAVVDVLVRKVEWTIVKTGVRRVVLSGGVSANAELRARMAAMAADREVDLYLPSLPLCTDNAAMVAAAGYHHFLAGERAGLGVNPRAYLPL